MATRRTFLKLTAAASLAPRRRSPRRRRGGRVVVVGGGFAGATAARTLKALEPKLTVTLVEPNRVFTACPFSNSVLAAPARDLRSSSSAMTACSRPASRWPRPRQRRSMPRRKTVTLADGSKLPYDRLVMAPGIDINWDASAGLRRSGGREDAACLEGGAADRAAAPAAAGDGRWRPGGDLRAGQSLPLPARRPTSGPA